MVSMIRLNPVTKIDDSIKRGLFSSDVDVLSKLKNKAFKELFTTDVSMEEGETEVAKHFGVQREWSALTNQWYENNEEVTGYKRYFELLFLVKSKSSVDNIWFSFFEGMHRHAAIIAGLLCSKFNHTTNELMPGSLTLDDFEIEGAIKNFKRPSNTVEEHLDLIFAKEFDAPMFHNDFHISAYVPKHTLDAGDLIETTRTQSVWISNFKKSSVTMMISKVLSLWLETTLSHSTRETRSNPNYRPALGKAHSMHYQEACSVETFNKKIHPKEGKDHGVYGYPDCLEGPVWDAYTRNPFDFTTRKDFLNTISLPCLDKTKETKMTPPYAISFQNLTTDVGPLSIAEGRKIDARHYNGYLIMPGIVYHIAAKLTNSLVTDRYGSPFEVGVINYIARYGNYMRKTPYLKLHGAYSKYVEMSAAYINGCPGDAQIIPVTMFLVTLYNACFMYQQDRSLQLWIHLIWGQTSKMTSS